MILLFYCGKFFCKNYSFTENVEQILFIATENSKDVFSLERMIFYIHKLRTLNIKTAY